jgi:hypothetical protein
VPTFRAWHRPDVHSRVVLLYTSPELTATSAQYIKLDAATLAEAHDDQMAVRTPVRIVSHLFCSIDCALVRRLAPPLSAIHRPVLDVFVAALDGVRAIIQLIADLANCFNDMAGIRRGGTSCKEVVVCLAFAGLELLELRAVFEFGANGRGSSGVEKCDESYTDYHAEHGVIRAAKERPQKLTRERTTLELQGSEAACWIEKK